MVGANIASAEAMEAGTTEDTTLERGETVDAGMQRIDEVRRRPAPDRTTVRTQRHRMAANMTANIAGRSC